LTVPKLVKDNDFRAVPADHQERVRGLRRAAQIARTGSRARGS
jgi:hypothetical protein